MFHKKKGIPEEDEVVICTVKKVLPHSIFVKLDEYDEKEAMIHISEISPGRIRNIRDFVREGKVIVCKVLRIHQEKKHIDLSLRRVSLAQRKKKEEAYKQEQKSEKLVELLTKQEKISMQEFYDKLGDKILETYGSLTSFFNEVLKNTNELQKEFQEGVGKSLIKLIKDKMKVPEVEMESVITLQSHLPNSISLIRETFKKTEEFAKEHNYRIKLKYISAPRYGLTIASEDYKRAEKILQEVSDFAVTFAKSNKFEAAWQKKS